MRRGDVEVLAVDLHADDAQRAVLAGLFGGAGQRVAAFLQDRVLRQHGVAVFASVSVDGLREVPLHAQLLGQVTGLVHLLARAVGEDIHLVQGHEVGILAADYFGQRVEVGRVARVRGAGAVDIVGHDAEGLALGRDDRLVPVAVVVVVVVVAGSGQQQQRSQICQSFHFSVLWLFVMLVRMRGCRRCSSGTCRPAWRSP